MPEGGPSWPMEAKRSGRALARFLKEAKTTSFLLERQWRSSLPVWATPGGLRYAIRPKARGYCLGPLGYCDQQNRHTLYSAKTRESPLQVHAGTEVKPLGGDPEGRSSAFGEANACFRLPGTCLGSSVRTRTASLRSLVVRFICAQEGGEEEGASHQAICDSSMRARDLNPHSGT